LEPSFLAFLQKDATNMLLFATAVVTGIMLLWPLIGRVFTGGVAQVGAAEAVQLMNRRDALVVDLRDKEAYAAGHVPNSRNIPLAELDKRLREIEKFKSRPVVLSALSDARSAAACSTLRKNGFSEVFTLRGGVRAWAEASLPLEKEKADGRGSDV
jgi:rhodanese-related sulfurtransferase